MVISLEAFSAALTPLEPAPSSRSADDRDNAFQQHLDRAREQPASESSRIDQQRQDAAAASRDLQQQQQRQDQAAAEPPAGATGNRPAAKSKEVKTDDSAVAAPEDSTVDPALPADDDDAKVVADAAAAAEVAMQAAAVVQAELAMQPNVAMADTAGDEKPDEAVAALMSSDSKSQPAKTAATAQQKQAAAEALAANQQAATTQEAAAQEQSATAPQAETVAEESAADLALLADAATAATATESAPAEQVVVSEMHARKEKTTRAEKAERKEQPATELASAAGAESTATQPAVAAAEAVAAATEMLQDQESAVSAKGDASQSRPENGNAAMRPATGPGAPSQHGAPDAKVLLPEAARATAGQETAARVSDADRVRFIQRVSRAFQAHGNQDGHLKIRLSPPELGALRLEITVRNGTVNARLEAETPAAQQLLTENLPALRERLAQQDIKIERFDVELMDQRGGNLSQQSDQQSNPERTARRATANNRLGAGEVVGVGGNATARPSRPSSDGRLNVVI